MMSSSRIAASLLSLVLALSAVAYAAGEQKFGKELTLKEKTPISKIVAAPLDYNGNRVLVEGTIIGVCAKRGCWIRIAGDKEFQSLLFKVEDGVMVFPMEVKGKTVLAEGVIAAREYSAEEIAEMEKEHGAKKEGECAGCSAKEGKFLIQLKGEGAVVRDGPAAAQ